MGAKVNYSSTHRICVVLAFLTLATFWPVSHHDFVNIDDPVYLTLNPVFQQNLDWSSLKWAFTTGYANNWHPLTWLSHMLDVSLFGMDPGGHHLISLFLHVANTVLLFIVLSQLTRAFWRSAFVACLFGIHPIHVESVVWASERKDVLSTFFL